ADGGPDGERPCDLLGLLMAARDADGSGLSEQEIRDEISTFLIAGHETTAMALTWTLALLSAYPPARQRLGDEADAAVRGRPPHPGQAALDHRSDQRGDAALPSGLDARTDCAGRRRRVRDAGASGQHGRRSALPDPPQPRSLAQPGRLRPRPLPARRARTAPL